MERQTSLSWAEGLPWEDGSGDGKGCGCKVTGSRGGDSVDMETNASLRSLLNDLIQTCKDGQEGYLTAAENVADGEVKDFCNQCSLQRAKFAGELQSLAHELGESNPEYASSVAGAVHRGWINLKSAIANREAHAILRECERGECCAVEQYDKVLQHSLPAPVGEVVSRQATAIRAMHDRVRTLADSAAPHWV